MLSVTLRHMLSCFSWLSYGVTQSRLTINAAFMPPWTSVEALLSHHSTLLRTLAFVAKSLMPVPGICSEPWWEAVPGVRELSNTCSHSQCPQPHRFSEPVPTSDALLEKVKWLHGLGTLHIYGLVSSRPSSHLCLYTRLLTPHPSGILTLPFSNFGCHIFLPHATDSLPASQKSRGTINSLLIHRWSYLYPHESFPSSLQWTWNSSLCTSVIFPPPRALPLWLELLAYRSLKTLCAVYTNYVALSKCSIIIYKLSSSLSSCIRIFYMNFILLYKNTLKCSWLSKQTNAFSQVFLPFLDHQIYQSSRLHSLLPLSYPKTSLPCLFLNPWQPGPLLFHPSVLLKEVSLSKITAVLWQSETPPPFLGLLSCCP